MFKLFCVNFILNFTISIFQFFPRKFILIIGKFIGSFFYFFIPFRKAIAMKNLTLAFPLWDINKKKLVLYNCYKHYGMVLVDFLCLPNLNKKNKNMFTISLKSKNIFNNNFGGILMSAHIGNWEYICPILSLNNIKSVAVTKVQHNKLFDIFFNKIRKFKHVKIISANIDSKAMIKMIEDGYYLGLASDQNAGNRGTKVKFFDQYTSIPKGAAAFHLKTNKPILLGFCILSKDLNYHLEVSELNVDGLSSNFNKAIKQINQRYSKILEQIILKNPHQYFWFHRKLNRNIYKESSTF